jgi:tRNA threonylcarbamoyladenosine biosynthesis protein TsaB
MKVLVIDTALGACTVGVFEDDRALAIRSEPMAKGHSERIGGFVRDVMAASGIGFEALDRIGVTVGPGSFTGLRVGLAFAHGLGEALDRPVIGVSTLAALAASRAATDDHPFAAVIDARRGQVYLQAFRDDAPLCPPQALAIDAAVDLLAALDCDGLVGTGAAILNTRRAERSMSPLTVTEPTVPDPSPQALARLTQRADPEGNPPRPLYLRAPDATPPTRLPGQARTPAP